MNKQVNEAVGFFFSERKKNLRTIEKKKVKILARIFKIIPDIIKDVYGILRNTLSLFN